MTFNQWQKDSRNYFRLTFHFSSSYILFKSPKIYWVWLILCVHYIIATDILRKVFSRFQ